MVKRMILMLLAVGVVLGGVLVIPAGLLRAVKGKDETGTVALSSGDNEAAAAKAQAQNPT